MISYHTSDSPSDKGRGLEVFEVRGERKVKLASRVTTCTVRKLELRCLLTLSGPIPLDDMPHPKSTSCNQQRPSKYYTLSPSQAQASGKRHWSRA